MPFDGTGFEPNADIIARKALVDAAGLIERRGLCKGRYINHYDGPLCTLGAIRVALGNSPDNNPIREPPLVEAVVKMLVRHLGLRHDKRWGRVADWNDAPAQTSESVVAALRAAAET